MYERILNDTITGEVYNTESNKNTFVIDPIKLASVLEQMETDLAFFKRENDRITQHLFGDIDIEKEALKNGVRDEIVNHCIEIVKKHFHDNVYYDLSILIQSLSELKK